MKSENKSEMIVVTLPKLGESIVGATVVQWLKKVGDHVALDEPLLEVATDKVNSEIPSPVCGTLQEICVHVDEEIEIGATLARISPTLSDNSRAPSADLGSQLDEAVSVQHCPHPAVNQSQPTERRFASKKCDTFGLAPISPTLSDNTHTLSPDLHRQDSKEEIFSPAVLRLAKLEGLTFDILRTIDGSGEGGRITKKDIEHFVLSRKKQEKKCPLTQPIESAFLGEEERILMSGMRKAIAENMVRSFYEAPHASLVMEADVTDVMKMIAVEKDRFFQSHGVKLTVTSFLVHTLAKAIQQFPMLNASLDGETIILKHYVNVGLAVNIDKGLVVPVIKNCQEKNLVSIAKAIADLSTRARSSKLSSHDVQEGTVTLTNFGMTGALIGVPIIRYPEVAIIGAGNVQKRVVVREDDSFAIRHMIYITLTFDHRVIDGIYGCQFLAAFKQHLEFPFQTS